jgi:hypothetical protein
MIGVVFQFGTKIIEIRIDEDKCLFKTGELGGGFFPIDNLKLSYQGVCREFPDLELRKAVKRFKEKMKSFKTEEEKVEYLINDLKNYGYVPLYSQKKGFRIKKFK